MGNPLFVHRPYFRLLLDPTLGRGHANKEILRQRLKIKIGNFATKWWKIQKGTNVTRVQRLGHRSENITARNPKVLPFLVYTSCLYTFVRADLACSRLRDSRVRWIEKAQTRNFSRAFFFRVFPTIFPTICTSLFQASADLIQAEASWKLSSTSEWLMFAWENVSLTIKEVMA